MDKDIVISIKTVILTFVLFLGAYVVYLVGPILGLLLVAVLIVIAMEPAVEYLMGKKLMNNYIQRSLAVSIVFTLFIIVFILALTLILPSVVIQGRKLISALPSQISGLPGLEGAQDIMTNFATQLPRISGDAFSFLAGLFSNVAAVFAVLFLALYMSFDWPNIKSKFFELIPQKNKENVKQAFFEIETSVGHWVKGQLILMLIVGLASTIGLLLLGVDYAIALGLLAGLLEIVPLIGPLLSGILAAIVGFSISPLKGFATAALFILIQQAENNILVPKVMNRVSGFSPLSVLVALMVGQELFGILGAIVAIPVTMILVIIVKHLLGVPVKS